MLWIVGALAILLVLTALALVLRRRGGDAPAYPHGYAATSVTPTGGHGRSGVTFGGTGPVDDVPIDQTVPLSRLGGAGWRDGSGGRVESTTDAYAGTAGTWAEPETGVDGDAAPAHEPQVTVDDAGARPVVDGKANERRGGHW